MMRRIWESEKPWDLKRERIESGSWEVRRRIRVGSRKHDNGAIGGHCLR